jgi:hypothetical protein
MVGASAHCFEHLGWKSHWNDLAQLSATSTARPLRDLIRSECIERVLLVW